MSCSLYFKFIRSLFQSNTLLLESLVTVSRMSHNCLAGAKLLEMDNVIRLKSSPEAVSTAVKLIKNGSVIAIPTDTIYGLAADAQNTTAIKKLYQIKSRNFTKPLAICLSDVNDIKHWADDRHLPQNLLKVLFPGPVTVILNRIPKLNPHLNPETNRVAIRIPKDDFVLDLVSILKGPIALTSANKSNETSSVCIAEFKPLWPQLSAVFDGGIISEDRSGSTIIDLTIPGEYTIVRKGTNLEKTVGVLKSYSIREC